MLCKYLKLTNGENLIVSTVDDCESFAGKEFVEVIDPVLISSVKFPRGPLIVETYVMQPWLKVSREGTYKIPVSSIIIATDVHDSAIEQYTSYIKDYKEQEMDLVGNNGIGESSEDSIDSLLESILGNSEEEEDESDTRRTGSSRTYH